MTMPGGVATLKAAAWWKPEKHIAQTVGFVFFLLKFFCCGKLAKCQKWILKIVFWSLVYFQDQPQWRCCRLYDILGVFTLMLFFWSHIPQGPKIHLLQAFPIFFLQNPLFLPRKTHLIWMDCHCMTYFSCIPSLKMQWIQHEIMIMIQHNFILARGYTQPMHISKKWLSFLNSPNDQPKKCNNHFGSTLLPKTMIEIRPDMRTTSTIQPWHCSDEFVSVRSPECVFRW